MSPPKPFKHQAKLLADTWKKTAYGVFWEQGCGKTRPEIDNYQMLFHAKEVNAMVVVAPPGVERNWASDELPKHMEPDFYADTAVLIYKSEKAETKWHQAEIERFLALPETKSRVLLISYDAVMTQFAGGKAKGRKKGYELLKLFLTRNRCFYILDEGDAIKTPGAKRTKRIVASAPYAPYRRILTGTPITTGPFDIYSQVRFLDPDFWKRRQIHNFHVFKQRYGEWITRAEMQERAGFDPGYDKLIGYRNLEELAELIASIGHRLTKEDAGLDLPPKLYKKAYHDLTPAQQKATDDLKEDFFTELPDGTLVTAELPIVRALRYHQIACGYLPTGDEDNTVATLVSDDKNPRLKALSQVLEGLTHPAIIWTRFSADIDKILALAERLKISAVRYDGKMSPDEAEQNKLAFQREDGPMLFVANTQKGATGITLIRARTVIYYSNSFRLRDRLQSEDRAHRIGQEHPVLYIDMCGGPVDYHIINNLVAKHDLAAVLTGDTLKEWIR